jgi:hypothetical protein
MMVLTDGSRPDVPPGGFLKCMHAIKAPLEGRYPCAVHTFGFGYDLDTELLVELAKEGGGMYCFIPDGSMVGTVFINALSNALTTAAFHVRLRMAFPNECRVRRVLGAQEEEVNVKKVGDCTISRAMLSENRRWTVAIDFTEPLPEGLLAISLSLRTSSGENVNVWEFDRVAFNPDTYLLLQVRNQLLKITASGSPPPIDVSAITDNQCLYEVQQLLADINGEMALAVQPRENFQRWGRHYLPSLKRAHELELCNNFKDPGVQIYTSPLFERLRDDAEEAFVRIPQPKSTYVGYGAATTVSTQPVDMSNYIDRAGGCFHSTCEVLLHNGQTISITELKRGDVVGTHGAVVECIVKSPCNSETPWVRCEKSGLILTAWHPVMDIGDDGEEEWVFPVEMSTTTPWQEPPGEDDHGIMYNVVLEKGTGEFICVNGVWCATLGHGIMNHPVLTHPFLGTDRVRDGLKLCKGYAETGVVNVIFVRSPITKLLDGVIDMEV